MLKRHGPITPDDTGVGVPCPACKAPICVGDYTAHVPLGPGTDGAQRLKARSGRIYTAIAAQVHYACATGIEDVGAP